jgi:hypothetical protein
MERDNTRGKNTFIEINKWEKKINWIIMTVDNRWRAKIQSHHGALLLQYGLMLVSYLPWFFRYSPSILDFPFLFPRFPPKIRKLTGLFPSIFWTKIVTWYSDIWAFVRSEIVEILSSKGCRIHSYPKHQGIRNEENTQKVLDCLWPVGANQNDNKRKCQSELIERRAR